MGDRWRAWVGRMARLVQRTPPRAVPAEGSTRGIEELGARADPERSPQDEANAGAAIDVRPSPPRGNRSRRPCDVLVAGRGEAADDLARRLLAEGVRVHVVAIALEERPALIATGLVHCSSLSSKANANWFLADPWP